MLLTPTGAEASLQPPEMNSGRAWEAPHHSEAQHAFQKGKITADFSFRAFCLFLVSPLLQLFFPCSPLQPVVAPQSTLTNVISSDV